MLVLSYNGDGIHGEAMMEESYYFEVDVTFEPNFEDLWATFCFENGSLGIQNLGQVEDKVLIRAYFSESWHGEAERLTDEFDKQFQASNLQLVRKEKLPNQNWREQWKDYFQTLDINQTWWISPPWEVSCRQKDLQTIIIEPGQGFGTGRHDSTALALLVMKEIWKGQYRHVLDVGCGSGILSIAAAKLGAKSVHAVDIEYASAKETAWNAKLNKMTCITSFAGTLDCVNAQYDLIVANMLCSELLDCSPFFAKLVNLDGVLICSGLLEKQLETFLDSFRTLGWSHQNIWQREQWCAVQLQLKNRDLL